MSPFAFALVAAIIFILLRCKGIRGQYLGLFSLAAAVEMNNIAGFFAQIGGREIAYADVALLAASLAGACCVISQPKLHRKQFAVSLLLVGTVLLGVGHTALWPPAAKIIGFNSSWDRYLFGLVGKTQAAITLQTALMAVRLILFLLNSYLVFRLEGDCLNRAASLCKTVTKLHILFALGEICTKYLFGSNVMTGLRDFLFGVGSNTYLYLQQRGDGVAIFGWTREASHLPEVMFFFIVLCVLTKDGRRQKLWMILAAVVMAMSMAFTALLYIGCIAVLLLCVYGRGRSRKTVFALWTGSIIFLVVCGILAADDYYASRLEGFIRDAELILSGKSSFSAGAVTSAKVRILGIVETWRAFCERPLFGLGLGTAYCHSGVVSLLANVGLAGTGLWIYYCIGCGNTGKRVFLLFAAVLLLPNILEGKLGMLYATHVLLVIQLIKNFERNEKQVAGIEIYSDYHHL